MFHSLETLALSRNLRKEIALPAHTDLTKDDVLVRGHLVCQTTAKGFLMNSHTYMTRRHSFVTKNGRLAIYMTDNTGFLLEISAAKSLAVTTTKELRVPSSTHRCQIVLKYTFGSVRLYAINAAVAEWRGAIGAFFYGHSISMDRSLDERSRTTVNMGTSTEDLENTCSAASRSDSLLTCIALSEDEFSNVESATSATTTEATTVFEHTTNAIDSVRESKTDEVVERMLTPPQSPPKFNQFSIFLKKPTILIPGQEQLNRRSGYRGSSINVNSVTTTSITETDPIGNSRHPSGAPHRRFTIAVPLVAPRKAIPTKIPTEAPTLIPLLKTHSSLAPTESLMNRRHTLANAAPRLMDPRRKLNAAILEESTAFEVESPIKKAPLPVMVLPLATEEKKLLEPVKAVEPVPKTKPVFGGINVQSFLRTQASLSGAALNESRRVSAPPTRSQLVRSDSKRFGTVNLGHSPSFSDKNRRSTIAGLWDQPEGAPADLAQ